MTEPLSDEQLEIKMKVDRAWVSEIRLRYSHRRSVKIATPVGDEFRTSESEVSWSIVDPKGPMDPKVAFLVGLKNTPELIRKVLFDLVVAGVMNKDDAQKRIDYSKASYEAMFESSLAKYGKLSSDHPEDQRSLRQATDFVSSSGAQSSTGSTVSSREDRGMPAEAGRSDGHALPGQEASPGSSNGG